MATYWDYPDYSTKTASNYYNSSVMATTSFPDQLVLIHPSEWVDESVLGSDFQSNQSERRVSLAGLGIHNFNMQGEKGGSQSSAGSLPNTSPDHIVDLPHLDHSGGPCTYDYHSGNTTGGLLELQPQQQLSLDLTASESCISEDSLFSDSSTDFALMFEQLSASTGLSIADFAEQLSVSAEVTLKRMAEEGLGSNTVSSVVDPFQRNPKEGTPQWSTPQLFLPRSTSWKNDGIGVNPADILPPDSPSPISTEDAHYLPTSAFAYETEISGHLSRPDDELTSTNTTNSPFMKQEEALFLPRPSQPNAFSPGALPSRSLSDEEQPTFPSPSSSEYSPEASIGQKRPAGSRRISHRIPTNSIPEDLGSQSPDLPLNIDESNLPPINLGTPVLDAHRGVDLEVLKAKGERYRLRNQGRDYDKRWLISFAGKLSARGELVDEFHCYVLGCKQKNKRRDHILIHVGAHLDQRPFKCMYCPSRFLRKNECKRHELSHTGLRPFSCHLCPYPTTTFVRQDLLKRHMKRTHRLDLKANKENLEEAYHPRKRTRY